MNKQIILKSRPSGMLKSTDLQIISSNIPIPKEGELLLRILYFTLPSYMRVALSNDISNYPPTKLYQVNEILRSEGIAQVVISNNNEYRKGDIVLGIFKWEEYSVANENNIKKLNLENIPSITASLSTLGKVGIAAYFGLIDVGKPISGNTIVVSGAAGSVGSLVGQIGKVLGCSVIGITGSNEKKDYLINELGFDKVLNYKMTNLEEGFTKYFSKGIDVFFDNVGGSMANLILPYMNHKGRIVLCGQVALYNTPNSKIEFNNWRAIISNSLSISGFTVSNYNNCEEEALLTLSKWIVEGKIKIIEDVIDGIENAPQGLVGVFYGENLGRRIIRVSEPELNT